MAWALLDDNFATHPKVKAALERHALARDLYVCVLCYCRRFRTGGVIRRAAIADSGFVGNARKAADALVEEGLWHEVEGGYRVHDYGKAYDDHSEKLSAEELRQKKREAGRKGGIARAVAQADTPQANFQAHAQADSKHAVEADSKPNPLPVLSVPHQTRTDRTAPPRRGTSPERTEPPEKPDPAVIAALVSKDILKGFDPAVLHTSEARGDIEEATKAACVKHGLAYDTRTVGQAVEQALARRAREGKP